MFQPARARSTIGARLSRVWRNWFAMVGRSCAGATALPPNATTIVSARIGPVGTGAQPTADRAGCATARAAGGTAVRIARGRPPRGPNPDAKADAAPPPSAPRERYPWPPADLPATGRAAPAPRPG